MDPDALILLRKVAERSAAEREEYYAQHGVSPTVRGQVELLLKAGERTLDSFAGHVASDAIRELLRDDLTPQSTPGSSAPRALLQPAAIGRYQVTRLLGRGGMSDVYLARDPMLERDIAVKLIAGGLDDEVARRRLVREASAAGRLRHPNIVTIFDAGEYEGQPYIAMEYVPGETLRALIRRRDPLPLGRRLALIEGACAGLAHAHRAGVVHLDIKPDNLILDESGTVKVLDFGIARVLSADALATRHVVGTLRYMSPEQVAGEPLDHRSDIFSLGSSLFELLTYVPAYAGSTKEMIYRIAAGPVPRLREIVPDTDPRLDEAVSRAMALEPDERFGDIDDFRAELARLRADLDPSGDKSVVTPDPLAAYTQLAPVVTPARALKTTSRKVSHRGRQVVLGVSLSAAVASAAGALWLWDVDAGSEPPPAATAASVETAAAPPVVEPEPAVVSPPPEVPRTSEGSQVWRSLALGDRKEVLRLLQSEPVDGDPQSTERLRTDVLSYVKQVVAQSRANAAAAPGAASTEAYRQAEELLGTANRREASRDPIGALGLLWDATDRYSRAIADARSSVTPAPAEAESKPLAESAPPVLPPALPSTRAEVQPPPPAPLGGARSGVAAAAEGTAPPTRPPPKPEDGVLEALDRYRAAYESRDASRVRQVLPSLTPGQIEQIAKTFEGVTSYEVDIRDPSVQVQSDSATANAMVVRRITTGFGSNEYSADTTFRLRRNGTGWVITDVTARQP